MSNGNITSDHISHRPYLDYKTKPEPTRLESMEERSRIEREDMWVVCKCGLVEAELSYQETDQPTSECNHKTQSKGNFLSIQFIILRGHPNIDDDLAEVIDYERRSRCGLGHPHRPTPVQIPGNFTEFADKLFANHFVTFEDGPFASALQHMLPGLESTQVPFTEKETAVIDHSPPPRSGSINSALGPEKRQRQLHSPTTRHLESIHSGSPQAAHQFRCRGLQNSAGGASYRIRQARSPYPSRSLKNPQVPSIEKETVVTDNNFARRRKGSQSPTWSGLKSSFGLEKRQDQIHSPSTQVPSTKILIAQFPPPRSGLENAAFGLEKTQHEIHSPPTRRLGSMHPRAAHRFQSCGRQNSAVGASNKTRKARSPYPSRSQQKPQGQDSDYSSFGAESSSPRIRISGAFPVSPPFPEHGNVSESSSDDAQTAAETQSCAFGSTSLRQASEIAPPPVLMPRSQSPPSILDLKDSASVPGSERPRFPALCHSSTQNELLPPNHLKFGVDVDKFDTEEKKAAPSTSDCNCRLSATRSILARGLDPLKHLLKQNTCDGQRYKETAKLFIKMFDEVTSVQECGEHVHKCPNSMG
ncbi:uncharacterized protein MELLADRAFT_85862 [Melampsora larici-populina 98AG31]|uniref:Uncharacterized protein n=1 Tax=Melampsora larici-populina (strain 98AG31 / pathotype 3-4-7) TaxID=747676 RepID=F4SDE7_MELLP|nr:uncharacterized protein MELLADRAFT_85862 [Melampsora larici-populina 98AG31]EGF97331.1 hypothetical protein MELLADRAFT_85862 [Melampsora larici-populina 98AG31]